MVTTFHTIPPPPPSLPRSETTSVQPDNIGTYFEGHWGVEEGRNVYLRFDP